MTKRAAYVRCETCDMVGSAPASLAWLGRHAHGTRFVRYFMAWVA